MVIGVAGSLAGILSTTLDVGSALFPSPSTTTSIDESVTINGQQGSQTNNFGPVYNTYEDGSELPLDTSRLCGDESSEITAGWGPKRIMFPASSPPDYVALNSIADSDAVGDERGFIRAETSGKGNWDNEVTIERDAVYRIRVSVSNSAISGTGLASTGTTVNSLLPTCTGKVIAVSATASSDNALPSEVYSIMAFRASEIFNLAYIEGSATLWNADGSRSTPLDRTLLTANGTYIGEATLDGVLEAGPSEAAWVTYEVRPQFAGD